MSYLLSNQILSSLVFNSMTVLELTAYTSGLVHTAIFLMANEFDLTDLCSIRFPIGILGQVWYLILSISDLCTLILF